MKQSNQIIRTTLSIAHIIPLLVGLFFSADLRAQTGHCDSIEQEYISPKLQIIKDFDNAIFHEYQSCVEPEPKKNITFVHGLGGSVASWDKVKNWTDSNYRAGVIIGNYNGAGWESSFHSVALKLNNDIGSGLASGINSYYPDRCELNDYVIAHSQGGLVARFLDREWETNTNGTFGDRKFYGLATFGTPHAGANIALTRKHHKTFIANFINAVYLKDMYKYSGYFRKVDKLIDSTEAFIERNLAPLMIAGLHTNTLDEMAPGSPTMNKLNSFKSKLHKVAFYSIEQEPECWRLLHNVLITPVEEEKLFMSVRDDGLIYKVENVRLQHLGRMAKLRSNVKWANAALKTAGVTSIFTPISPVISLGVNVGAVLAYKLKKKWLKELDNREDAVRFLNNANTQWRFLIGSYHRDSTETTLETRYELTWKEKYGFLGKWYSQKRTGFKTHAAAEQYYSEIKVYKKKDKSIYAVQSSEKRLKFFPSDGVVLANSQKAFPGVGAHRTSFMKNDNHFQQRNSPNTMAGLEKLYSGQFDSFFRLELK